MKLQGCVRGAVYPVVQKSPDEPIDGTRRCKWCGQPFVIPKGRGRHTYCSDQCRTEALKEQHRQAKRREFERKRWTA